MKRFLYRHESPIAHAIAESSPSEWTKSSFQENAEPPFSTLSFRNLHLPSRERGDVAEALDEVFLDDGSISLQQAEAIGSGAALDGYALDIRTVADCDEREAVGGRELNALGSE